MKYPFISTIYYEENIFVYNYLYLLVNPIINRMVAPINNLVAPINRMVAPINNLVSTMYSSLDPFIGEDFMINICQNETQIFWETLNYTKIKQTMDALANNFGDEKYYWDLRDADGQLLAECRSGTFELDGEISVRPNNNHVKCYETSADAMIYQINQILYR